MKTQFQHDQELRDFFQRHGKYHAGLFDRFRIIEVKGVELCSLSHMSAIVFDGQEMTRVRTMTGLLRRFPEIRSLATQATGVEST